MSEQPANEERPTRPESGDPNDDAPGHDASAPGKPLWRNPWVLAFLVGIAFVHMIRPLTRHVPEPPAVLGTLPAWQLIDQDGKAFGSKDLAGSPYVVSFFFTSCVTICPKIMNAVKDLQERYEQSDMPVRLVSITVDPETDTPTRLKEKARAYGVDSKRWRLLTGDQAALQSLIIDGFKTYMGERVVNADNILDIGHGAKLILVDGEGGVRGHYETDASGVDEIFWRSDHVLRASR
jgi:protein SCO1/2